MNWDINEVIATAKALDIKLTNAEIGTDICQCWIDRVVGAWLAYDRGDMEGCQDLIDSANAYAI
jgi:hypothetical protein